MKATYNKFNTSVSRKKSFLRFSCCSSLAAVAILAILATSCQNDDATAPATGGTPLVIGKLNVQGTCNDANVGTRAYNGDSYTAWQWGEGEEIIVKAINGTERISYSSTYMLGGDGSWVVKPGSTLRFDDNGPNTYPEAIYTQDIDGGDYKFTINSYGGTAKSTLGEEEGFSDAPFYTDQSTKTRYQGTDYLFGTATLGADHALTATLLHQSVDVAIIVKRGIGWGSTEEAARTAFLTHITDKAVPKIPTSYDQYAVTPFCSYKNGDEAVYRAHIPVSYFHKAGSCSTQTTTIAGITYRYINVTLTNAQILKLTHVTGADLTATYNLTSDATSGIMQGKRLTITITYDNIAGLSTHGVTIGNWTTVNGGEMDGNYIGTAS
jgi:hypothetical protein